MPEYTRHNETVWIDGDAFNLEPRFGDTYLVATATAEYIPRAKVWTVARDLSEDISGVAYR